MCIESVERHIHRPQVIMEYCHTSVGSIHFIAPHHKLKFNNGIKRRGRVQNPHLVNSPSTGAMLSSHRACIYKLKIYLHLYAFINLKQIQKLFDIGYKFMRLIMLHANSNSNTYIHVDIIFSFILQLFKLEVHHVDVNRPVNLSSFRRKLFIFQFQEMKNDKELKPRKQKLTLHALMLIPPHHSRWLNQRQDNTGWFDL